MKTKFYISDLLKLNWINLNRMRRLSLLFIFLTTFVCYSFSQKDTVTNKISKNNNHIIIEINDKAKAGNKECENIIDKVPIDTNIMETANKLFIFIEYEDGLVIDRIDKRTGEKKRVLNLNCNDFESKRDTNKFRGHWSGFEVGINDFVNSNFSLQRPEGYDYMDLNNWRSWNVNINFAQLSIPRGKNRVGLVTGLGLEMNYYFFKGENSIQTNELTDVIEERILENDIDIKKSKFITTYLTIPLLLEAQLGRGKQHRDFYVSGGIIGGLNIGSTIKIKHKEDGIKHKLIERGSDLNLNKFRMGITLRMGYKDKENNSSGLYATYYLTELFEESKGPELYPFAVGFRIDF